MKFVGAVTLAFGVLSIFVGKSLQIKHTADTIDHNDPLYKKETGHSRDELVKSGDYISPEEMFGSHWNTSDPVWKDFTKAKPDPKGRGISDKKSADESVFFTLHTQAAQNGSIVTASVDALKGAGWNSAWPVKIIIHGYLQNAWALTPLTLRNAYLESKTEANILVVDWGHLAGGDYFTATQSTIPVAEVVAKFIQFAVDNKMLPGYDRVHVIGHSLGAHIGGAVGASLQQKGKTIGRISGLDPAGPGYSESSVRLDSSDAAFVDTIHTNMKSEKGSGFRLRLSLGLELKSGHADFYPNGGEQQPNCVKPRVGDLFGTCSHRAAVEFFQQSILNKDLYPSCPCDSWNKYNANECKCDSSNFLMGEHCSPSLSGSYYLKI